MQYNATKHVGVDPGARNYAIVGVNAYGKLTYVHMLRQTVWSVSQENYPLRKRYRLAIYSILKALYPKNVICENFTVRGFGSNLIELVGLMNGALQAVCDELAIEEYMVIPSSWKRELCKRLRIANTNILHEQARKQCVPPHIADALCLAMYLQGGRSFARFNTKLYHSNIKRAAQILPQVDKIKPRQVRKVKTIDKGRTP